MTKIDVNKKIWARSSTPELIIIMVILNEIIVHHTNHWQHWTKCQNILTQNYVTTHTSLLQNKFKINTENTYVITIKNIHTSMFTYSIVTWDITLASSEKKENRSSNNTIPRHSLKCINCLGSHQIFPTTTRHKYLVLLITYVALLMY